MMKRICFAVSAAILLVAGIGFARQSASGPYKVTQKVKAGGDGGFDYVYADVDGRKLYVPRLGQGGGRVSVFDLDTFAPAGEIDNASGHGAAVDPKSGHGFVSSKPVVMWDTKNLSTIKTIDVQGGPDGILFDPFNERVWVFSHGQPNATIIDAKDGSIVNTMDLGGAPEQAVTDGKGHIYVDLEDKDAVAAVDAANLKVTATYSLNGKGGGPGGLAFDAKNHILFAACHTPQTMVILNADNGNVITALPIGMGTDGATFNPNTMEAFSSNRDGTLTVVKENSPTDFTVEQNVQTMTGAKTLTLDSKTNRVILIAAEYQPPAAPPAGAAPAAGAPAAGAPGGPTQAGAPGGDRGPGGQGGPGGGRGGFARAQMIPGSFTILAVGK